MDEALGNTFSWVVSKGLIDWVFSYIEWSKVLLKYSVSMSRVCFCSIVVVGHCHGTITVSEVGGNLSKW